MMLLDFVMDDGDYFSLHKYCGWFEVITITPQGYFIPIDVRNCWSDTVSDNLTAAYDWWLGSE